MSTAGTGTVAMGAGVVLLAGAAIVGAGILVTRGIIWCGQKIEENYQQTCQQWTDLTQAAQAENRANVQEMSTRMSTYMSAQLAHLAASDYLAAPDAPRSIDQQALRAALAQVRATIGDARLAAQKQADTENDLLALRLRAEIKNGRGILPPETLKQAEQALSGSPDVMRAMLDRLDTAWDAVSEAEAVRTRTIRQTQQILSTMSTQLYAIDSMLREAGTQRNPAHVEQQRALERQAQQARDLLAVYPKRALEVAQAAQQAVEPLLAAVTAFSQTAWERTRNRVNEQAGQLEALSLMIEEAKALKLVEMTALEKLAQRVSGAQREAQLLLQNSAEHLPARLERLAQRVRLLKDDVFAQVKTNQQRIVAEAIQATLAELGFRSDTGEPPAITVNGDSVRVEALVARGSTNGPRDDKVISFDVSRDGQVHYDFSGYVGNSCVKDARSIFKALQAKGIFILNDHALEDLRRIPEAQLTTQTLSDEHFALNIESNKTQAQLAEEIKGVLEDMGYTHLRQSSVGGSIELEAFEGQIGYRVVLPPEGEARVYKDANYTDISSDTQDQIVATAQNVRQRARETQEKKRKPSYTRKRQGQISGY